MTLVASPLPGLPHTLPGAGRRLLLIHNPTAGFRRPGFLRRTVHALRDSGCRLELRETAARGDAERFAREAAGVDAVVAAGGDGTVNEVVNGLGARPVPLPLGVIPLGTANVLAGELGLPDRPAALAALLAAGPVRLIHPGRAGGRLFTMMAGAGLDAAVVEGVNPRLKRLTGKGAYVVETMGRLLAGPRPDYTVTVEDAAGGVERVRAASCIVAKGHFYGGRFVLAPQADLGRPQLHACLFECGGRAAALAYSAGMVLGLLERLPGFRVLPAVRVGIDGPAGEPVQGDGDVIARLPVEIALAPSGLPVIAPPPVRREREAAAA
ncbi:diacylglycerol/lipid kinase family protein [Rhodocista pekingensis]|uniref:Diacylglycerol/lipid kinase family protein n=1 Tax=Rhodocista pekingensis TaxID=201185 RepID=A0ABW2KW74_9PROT